MCFEIFQKKKRRIYGTTTYFLDPDKDSKTSSELLGKLAEISGGDFDPRF